MTHIRETEGPAKVSKPSEDYPAGYVPSEEEEYMNPQMLAYFRDLMIEWRDSIARESESTVNDLKEHSTIEADPNDQASLEYEQTVELRTRDRGRKLIAKIDSTLDRLERGDYGYCEETGDPIGVKRLMARPIATLCIEAKRMQEKEETGYAG